ncbi:MAG TPA: MFS transporter, partial [Spirochaetia bacterium]|nr:MFS transporter [Spirochaetia bacterium]
MRITSPRVATGSSFLSMFFLGVGVAIVGATARAVGLSPAEIGYLIAAQNVGFGIAVVVGGALSDLYRKPVILTIGLVLLAISFALLYRSESLAVNLAVMLLMGSGMGAAEAVTDALLLEMHTRNESGLVTINHFFVSIGSVVITLYLMALELDWSASLSQVAVVLAALAVLVAFLRPPGHVGNASSGGQIFRELTGDWGIALLFLSGVGAIGLGVGSAGVITTFATELRSLDASRAQVILAVFLVGLAVGRILVGLLGKGRSPGRMATIAASGALIFSVAFYLIPLPAAALLPLAGAMGLTVAPLLPLTIATAGLRYRHIAGSAMGLVKLSIPIGGIVIPGLIGIISDLGSFRAALYLFPASA